MTAYNCGIITPPWPIYLPAWSAKVIRVVPFLVVPGTRLHWYRSSQVAARQIISRTKIKPVHDLNATHLHLYGFDHEQLTYRFHGKIVKEILA